MQKYTETKNRGEDATGVSAFIYRWNDALKRWEYPGLPRRITFSLQKTSTEPGECMNYPPPVSVVPNTFDMFLHQGEDRRLNYPAGEDYRCQTATTKNPVINLSTNVRCEDFGGHTKVTATAPDCVQLRYGLAPNKTSPSVILIECKDNIVTVPRDDDGNDIADAYEEMMGRPHPNPDEDLEKTPEGAPKSDGDGLSIYEEYRGFRCHGVHKRVSWKLKDLFICDNGFDTTYFARASGLACHNIDESEYTNDVVINFNSKSHALGFPQHGVLITENHLREYTEQLNAKSGKKFTAEEVRKMGRAGACGVTRPKDENIPTGPPKNTDHIDIDSDHVAKMSYAKDRIVAHELGHAVGMKHHSWRRDPFGSPKFLDYSNYPKGGLAGKMTSSEFWVNPRPGLSSGDWDCIMRYGVFGSPGCPAVFEVAKDKYETAEQGNSWQHFCTEPAGTKGQSTDGNADQHQAGDCEAGFGDCRHQMQVNDK